MNDPTYEQHEDQDPEINRLNDRIRDLEAEKRRRVYYQNIVYRVCNVLDEIVGSRVVCGTMDEPSTEVEDQMVAIKHTVATLEAENVKLSAYACPLKDCLVSDDHGHSICRLEAENERLRHKLFQTQNQANRIRTLEKALKNCTRELQKAINGSPLADTQIMAEMEGREALEGGEP